MAKSINDPRYREVVNLLASARRANSLSQTDLAQKLSRRQQFVSKYETGERRLDVVEFIDIARILEVDFMPVLINLAIDIDP